MVDSDLIWVCVRPVPDGTDGSDNSVIEILLSTLNRSGHIMVDSDAI